MPHRVRVWDLPTRLFHWLLAACVVLLVATVWYLILTSVVSVIQFYVERYYARGATRSLPPTPLQKLRTGLTDLRARVRREAAV